MERLDVEVFDVELDERLPVDRVVLDPCAVVGEPVEGVLRRQGEARQVGADVSRPAEEEPVPALQGLGAQVQTGDLVEARRRLLATLQAVGPAVERAHDVAGAAPALEDDRLAVTADVGDALDPFAPVHERPALVPAGRVVVAEAGGEQLVADVARSGVEEHPLLDVEDLGAEVPRHGDAGDDPGQVLPTGGQRGTTRRRAPGGRGGGRALVAAVALASTAPAAVAVSVVGRALTRRLLRIASSAARRGAPRRPAGKPSPAAGTPRNATAGPSRGGGRRAARSGS